MDKPQVAVKQEKGETFIPATEPNLKDETQSSELMEIKVEPLKVEPGCYISGSNGLDQEELKMTGNNDKYSSRRPARASAPNNDDYDYVDYALLGAANKASSKVLFNTIEDELLVEMVAKQPFLYDLESHLYKDQNVKDNAWKEIGEVLGRAAEDCKKRWRNIKDTHKRRKRKGKGRGACVSTKSTKWALADMLCFLDKVEHKKANPSTGLDESNNEHDRQQDDTDEANKRFENLSDDSSSEANNFRVTDTRKEPPEATDDVSTSANAKRQFYRSDRYCLSKKAKLNANILAVMRERNQERSRMLKKIVHSKSDPVDLFFLSISESVKKLRPGLIHEAKIRSLQLVFELEQRSDNGNVAPYDGGTNR